MAIEGQNEVQCLRQNGEAPIPQIPDHDLLRRIGRGSYGDVWLARNAVGTWRAIKVVYRNRFKEAHPYEREFNGIRKYEPISRTHEGLMDVLQIGRNESAGYFYYVMELADDASTASNREQPSQSTPLGGVWSYTSRTLASEIRSRGRLPVPECITLGLTLSLGLEHLHRHGLIHRDVKPSNIIFVNGVPRLADIGLVTELAEAESFVGTEGFIPPEGPTSAQSDIYALGKVLYEASMGKDRQKFPEPFSELGTDSDSRLLMELNAILLRACARSTRERYASAGQMHADLALLHSGQSVKQKHALERKVKFLSRAAAAIAAALVLGVAPYGWVLHEAHVAQAEAAHARRAESESKEQVWRAYLAEARAGRWSHQAGRRFEGLELLKKAAAIRPSLELRNEAIACMALTDLQTIREWTVSTVEPALAFDAAYERYAVLDPKGTIHVHRVDGGEELVRFEQCGPHCKAMDFSRDGRLLGIAWGGGLSERFQLFRVGDGVRLLDVPRSCRNFDFSADNRWLAISYDEPTNHYPISILDLSTGKEAASFKHGTLPYYLQFNPRQPMLLLCSDDTRTVRVWEWDTGTTVLSFAHPDWVQGIAWNPTGETFATACGDKQVYLWDFATGQRRSSLAGHEWSAADVSFSPDGQFLASRGWDGLVRIWDPVRGQELVNRLVAGAMTPFCQSAPRFGISGAQGRIAEIEVASSGVYRLLNSDISAHDKGTACDFSPDGQWLVSSDLEGTSLWETGSGSEAARISRDSLRDFPLFERNGTNLLLRTAAGLERWHIERNPSAGRCSLRFEAKLDSAAAEYPAVLNENARFISDVTGGALRLLDSATGQERRRIKLPYDPVYAALSGGGRLAVTWTSSSTNLQVWDVDWPNLVQTVPAHLSIYAAFSPNGQWLAVGDGEEFRLWDTATWQSRYRVPRVPAGYWGWLAFSGDSRLLAVAISRSSVRLMEAATGRELATLEAPQRMAIQWLALDRDGTRLAVVSASGPTQLWDLRLLRKELVTMTLDWPMPPYPPEPAASTSELGSSEGRPRLALHLDGKSAFVGLPNLAASAPEGTIEMWFKPESWSWTNAPDGLFLWAGTKGSAGSGAGDGINLGTHPGFGGRGELMFGIHEKEWHWAKSDVAPIPGQWHHAAATWGFGGLKLYVNGKLSGSDPYNGPAPGYTVTNLLGCSSWEGSFFQGDIDEVRLWRRARSESEIQSGMSESIEAPQRDLLGYWRFEGQSPTLRARDYSGRGHSGFLAGGAAYVPSTAPIEPDTLLAGSPNNLLPGKRRPRAGVP